jgi:hypothetical protein
MPKNKRRAENTVRSRPVSPASASGMPKKKWWQFWK